MNCKYINSIILKYNVCWIIYLPEKFVKNGIENEINEIKWMWNRLEHNNS